MARLIDIEEDSLLKTVTDGHLSAKALWRRILRQPTVDAAPVRHGRWIEHHEPYTWMGYSYWSCSECGFECGYEKDIRFRTNYCPHCGAKMDEGKENE